MQKPLLAIFVSAAVIASSLLVISQNHGWSTETPAPSDAQVTSIPKTSRITLQLKPVEEFTNPNFNETVWIPLRSLTVQYYSEMVDVSQYRTVSVMTSLYPARQVNSSDATSIFENELLDSLAQVVTYVTFVDPETGASTTIQINKDTYSVPVAGPVAFVSIGESRAGTNSTAAMQMTAVMYLSS
jgi:hypothetical protein